MFIDCFRQLASVLRQGNGVLATVTQVKGSVPREVGAKMIVTANHPIFETIGGGAGEAKVIQIGHEVLKTGQKQAITIDLTGSLHRQTEGICGGQMVVWLERWSGENAIALVDQIVSNLRSGRAVTLITPFDQGQSPYLWEDFHDIPQPENAFVETLSPPPILLIIGAGHVGEQLAKVADLIGFELAIQDDRPEWANKIKYPQAEWIFNEPIADALQHLSHHDQLYIAMVTRGYSYDLEALATLLKREKSCRYIGMIGSEKRVKTVYQLLLKRGITQSQLASIYAPIGLDIEALTPVEIAVSITAELIMIRRGGTGHSLSTHLRQWLSQVSCSLSLDQ